MSARAWLVLAFLVSLNTLNFVDRTLPQAFIVDITSDLQLSYTEFTLIVGPAFAIIYALTGLFTGVLADRVHRPRLIALGVTIWSVMTMATGLARNWAQFAGARALVAVGESTLSPSALSMLSASFPKARHGVATSLYYLGISIGGGSAFLIAGTLGQQVGWRACFIILGGVGLVMALLCLAVADPRQKRSSDDRQPHKPAALMTSIQEALSAFTAYPALGWIWLAAVILTFSQGASVLDQAWLVREVGMASADAQILVGLVFTSGSITGSVLGGFLADWFAGKWAAGRLYYLALLVLLLAPAAVALRFAEPSSIAFVALLFFGSAGFTLGYGAIVPAILDLAPERLHGAVLGATLLGMALLGSATGNVFSGVLADTILSLGWSTPLRAAGLTTNLLALLALPCLALSASTYLRDRRRAGEAL